MAKQRIFTADELMAMTPDDRQALFDQNSSTDESDVPAAMLASAKTAIRSHIETNVEPTHS